MAADNKYDGVDELGTMTRPKGFSSYDEGSDGLSDIPTASKLEQIISTFESDGLDLLEEPKPEFDKPVEEVDEDVVDIDLPPGVGDKLTDPVRQYLREMGSVPLLTRQGEIEIAVNGQVRQRSDLNLMIWDVPNIISQLSQQVRLLPGDLIYTGTPEGVGPVVSGDVMVGRIAKLGELRIKVA